MRGRQSTVRDWASFSSGKQRATAPVTEQWQDGAEASFASEAVVRCKLSAAQRGERGRTEWMPRFSFPAGIHRGGFRCMGPEFRRDGFDTFLGHQGLFLPLGGEQAMAAE